MCQLKSALILKDRIFIPDYDSHSQMLNELGIEDNQKNAESLFVRAELYPKNGDVFSPIDEWIFHVDQDILLEWYVENYDKERMVKAVKEWADKRVLVGKNGVELHDGVYYIKDSTVKACDSATVVACDSATVKAYGSATVIIPGWSSNNRNNIIISENATIKDCITKTIWQSGDWKIELVGESNG